MKWINGSKMLSFKRTICCINLRKLIHCCIFAAITALLFQSCELEPNLPENVIEVKTLNINGLQYNNMQHYVEISIGEYPAAIPDIFGYCRFENKNIPYDLESANYNYNIHWGSFIYHNLTNKNPLILQPSIEPNNIYTSSYNICLLRVNFPTILQNKIGKLKFISKDLFIQEDKIIESGSYTEHLELKIPIDKTSIEGKIIFLEGGYNNNGWWETFDNFGIKEVLAKTDVTETLTFSQQDIQYNPEESAVDFSVNYPENFYDRRVSVSLSFPGYNLNSDINLFTAYEPYPGSFYFQNVPASLGIEYNIKIKSTYKNFSSLRLTENMKIANVQPGSTVNIVHDELPVISPANNQTGITRDSCLRAGNSEEKGIYLFYLYCGYNNAQLVIVTDKSSIRIGDIYSRKISFIPNYGYGWAVQKIHGYNSIDEFTGSPFIFNDKYRNVTGSGIRNFTTAP
jgi:hypothetical protein